MEAKWIERIWSKLGSSFFSLNLKTKVFQRGSIALRSCETLETIYSPSCAFYYKVKDQQKIYVNKFEINSVFES